MRRHYRGGLALGITRLGLECCATFGIVKYGSRSLELGIIKRVFRRAKTISFLFCSGAGGCYYDAWPVFLSRSKSF